MLFQREKLLYLVVNLNLLYKRIVLSNRLLFITNSYSLKRTGKSIYDGSESRTIPRKTKNSRFIPKTF
ncbi:hypothetical protein DRO91_06840 [Candidatus Heimdallarchaeota archaeon]|nr:MAG: hypothetical protein DRO91_06840 [Candidatus Heimdallarchaeota archaeon]RLI72042.1 MAG: hypothetical protein DRP02_03025 [Candidatus Gerdarchaeota archaeon]